ncbi:unnamed protein product, partial [Staurois parvus]
MPISVTYQCCQSMPPISPSQCHLSVSISASFLCSSVLPNSATYLCPQCRLTIPISAAYQCQSVPPISASHCCLSVPISDAYQCHI